LRTE